MRKFSVLLTALLLIGVSAVFGQERSISGKVLDSESGEPLVGVPKVRGAPNRRLKTHCPQWF